MVSTPDRWRHRYTNALWTITPLDGSQVKTCIDGLELVGSRIDLAGAEIELINKKDRENVLRNLLCARQGQI